MLEKKDLETLIKYRLREEFDFNLEPELNVIGNINKTEIKGDIPDEAQYAQLSPSGDFIQKFYKFDRVKFNDGSTQNILKYKGEQGSWQPSYYNSQDYGKLKNHKFLKIIDTQ